jgi:proteasome assembly chaperone (PAC2) family protein
MPPGRGGIIVSSTRLLGLLVFAGLIGNTAAGLAGRLAGSLALAAAAVLGALAKVTSLDGIDVLHDVMSSQVIIL